MLYVRLILLMSVIGVVGGGYAYFNVKVSNLEAQNAQLEANNRTLKENQVQLEQAVNIAQKSLKDAEENAKKSAEQMNKLNKRNNELNAQKQEYLKVFRDHNLTRLARAKPGMIEKRANNKTQTVFRELEDDTKELMDADDGDATNGVQPDAASGVGS